MLKAIRKYLSFTFLAISLIVPACVQAQTKSPFAGIWQGTLDVGQVKLRFVLNITEAGNDSLAASLDSPDQGVKGIPASKVRVAGDSVVVEVASILGKFEGLLQQDRNSMTGTLKQSGAAFPLDLKRIEAVAEAKRPQVPMKPYPYLEEEVSYENTKAGIKLAGTFTKPSTGGPFPAVILITGSGPQDRNESLMGHSPFLVLADHLTRRGIAVLRVDDRGVGGSTGSVMQSTAEDFASDVLVGMDFLKRRSDVRADRIGLVGHSEGGIVAPIAAARSSDVAFIVLMAGTGLPGDEIILMQTALIMKKSGVPEESIDKITKNNERIYSIIKSEKDTVALRAKLVADLEERWNEWGADYEKQGIQKEKAIEAQLKQVMTLWFRSFIAYDPRQALRKVKCPVFALNGELDLQVPPKENLREIEKALKESGNKNITVKELPGLNHLFQTATTGLPTEYGLIEETMSPLALESIGKWIEGQVKK